MCIHKSVYVYIHANFQAVATLSTTEKHSACAHGGLSESDRFRDGKVDWDSLGKSIPPGSPLSVAALLSSPLGSTGPRPRPGGGFFFAEPMNASFRRVDERSSPKKGTWPNPKHISILPNMKLNPDWVLDLFIFRSPKLRASNFTDFTVVPWD